MFQALKYLLLANLYSRAKKNIIALFVALLFLIVVTFIMGDIIDVSNGVTLYSLIALKWFFILATVSFIVFNLLKIINLATTPFEKEKKTDKKREKILEKENLLTKSDIILEKYTKAQS